MAIYSDSIIPKLTAVLRYYEVHDYITNKKVTKVELYLEDCIEYYSQVGKNKFVLDDVVPHHFGTVPVVHYLNNAEAMGDFECALSQIDAYDRTISTNLDEIEKFSNAYLILQGLDGTSDDEMRDALKNLALKVPEGADISWLTKDLSSTTVFEQLKVLDEKIHTMTQVPNLTDESFANNSSGVAIQYKLTAFENLIAAKERKFEQGLRKRLELIVTALNLKGNNFDAKDISITFDRNLPNDLLNISQVVANLGAYLPIETLLPIIPFIKEPQEVLDLLDKRQEDIKENTKEDIKEDTDKK
jgi:SPP1 family phage portal protein